MKTGKNQQVIMRLIDAVSDNDKDRIQSFLSDDTILQSTSSVDTPSQQARWDLVLAANTEKVDWQVDQLEEDESGKVLTRGNLRFLVNGQWNEFPVNGAFEVKGSKIVQWH